MLVELLDTRIMVKQAMKGVKEDKVIIVHLASVEITPDR
jgi:hypothetical protein